MTSYSELNTLSWQPAEATAGDGAILGLIERGIAGEESAYLTLYNHYAAMIYRLTYSLLQDRQDAEEVLQDSFEYAFRRLDQYDARKASFKTWLYRIAISRCHNKRRRKWLPTFSLSQWVDRQITDTETPAPEDASMLTGQQRMVWEALGQLSPKLR
jgi:RNA polymerase sigma-70 factor (ECF subfamily)